MGGGPFGGWVVGGPFGPDEEEEEEEDTFESFGTDDEDGPDPVLGLNDKGFEDAEGDKEFGILPVGVDGIVENKPLLGPVVGTHRG